MVGLGGCWHSLLLNFCMNFRIELLGWCWLRVGWCDVCLGCTCRLVTCVFFMLFNGGGGVVLVLLGGDRVMSVFLSTIGVIFLSCSTEHGRTQNTDGHGTRTARIAMFHSQFSCQVLW